MVELDGIAAIQSEDGSLFGCGEFEHFIVWDTFVRASRITRREHVMAKRAQFLHNKAREVRVRVKAGLVHESGDFLFADRRLDFAAVRADIHPRGSGVSRRDARIVLEQIRLRAAEPPRLLQHPHGNPHPHNARIAAALETNQQAAY
jgi:hypothetical protein